jgi:hypothetical protein
MIDETGITVAQENREQRIHVRQIHTHRQCSDPFTLSCLKERWQPVGLQCYGNVERGGDRLCGLVVKVPGYRSRGPGSILGANGVHSAS